MEANKPKISFIPEDELEEYNKNTTIEKDEVYKQINTELIYQDLRWKNDLRPDGVPDEKKPVAEWLNYIEYHLVNAKNYNYHLDKNNSLHELRKVAALAIRALMIHGCPLRDLSGNDGTHNCDLTPASDYNCECKKNQ